MMKSEIRLLQVNDIDAFYGSSQALFGMHLEVREGEVVALLGRNGMGKTTTVRAIMNLVSVRSGSISFNGRQILNAPPYRIARLGLGLVPEGRQIFPTLTVRENLLATAACRFNCKEPWDLHRVYRLFPILADRCNHLGNQLSGGEQQMLAIGRALMTNPQLLILDEATEGLAPLVRTEIMKCLAHLKSSGQSILVIDKNFQALNRIADRHTIIEKGSVAWTGTSRQLQENPALRYRYLGV
jgi:branched-chain amino acid transport system ATP-binding protein